MGQDQDKDFGLKPGVAIGYSIACNLGGERQMTVQCFVDESEPDEAVHARIDRVFRVVDRQKAKYDLDREIKEFEEVALHTRNFLNAIPMADRAARAQVETLGAELLGLQEARKEVYDEAYTAGACSSPKAPCRAACRTWTTRSPARRRRSRRSRPTWRSSGPPPSSTSASTRMT
jgi:hypothetical protein